MLGQVDLAHPPGAEPPPEAILADLPGLGDLPAQPGQRAGPKGRAEREHEQDHRVEEEQADAWGVAQQPSVPEPIHRVGIPHDEDQQSREGKQRQWPHHQRGPPPALRDVKPVGEDQDGDQKHDVLHRELRHHLVAAQRIEEHQPVLGKGDPTRHQPDHPQLQGLEPGQRDGPAAPEQGDHRHEGQNKRHVDLGEGQVLTPEDGAPPKVGDPQHEDVDDRQLTQPRTHDRSGLGDRLPRGLWRDRRPRSKAPGVVSRRVPAGGDRLGLHRGADSGVGAPACGLIRRRAGRGRRA